MVSYGLSEEPATLSCVIYVRCVLFLDDTVSVKKKKTPQETKRKCTLFFFETYFLHLIDSFVWNVD